MRLSLAPQRAQTTHSPRVFELPVLSLPMFFWTNYESGVAQMQFVLGAVKEHITISHGYVVACPHAKLIYWYANGSQVRVRYYSIHRRFRFCINGMVLGTNECFRLLLKGTCLYSLLQFFLKWSGSNLLLYDMMNISCVILFVLMHLLLLSTIWELHVES